MENKFKAMNFEFTNYEFKPEEKRASFSYKTEFENKEAIIWKEEIILPDNISDDIVGQWNKKSGEGYLAIEKLLQSLHIILGISYWKFYCPPAITFAKVKDGATHSDIHQNDGMSKQEADFWNMVYKKGLGEFFYRNNLNPNISPKFLYDNKGVVPSPWEGLGMGSNGYLVGVSGGKDSIVGVELLKEAIRHGSGQAESLTAFYVETLAPLPSGGARGGSGRAGDGLVDNVTKLTGLTQLKIQRILDAKVFEKHQYNGHIPISAIYAFLGIFASVLYKYNGFVVSNEYSSNFGNAKYKGLEINHQWSKTFEFEKMFSNYIKEFIGSNLEYFSILRPFYEIRIAEMFSKYPKYFYSFSSCNTNFKTHPRPLPKGVEAMQGLWCGKCAKCVFVFTLMSAFLSKKELINIFKKNLYQDESLLPIFKDVLGFGNLKPFDCVGTFEEAKTAFKMASKNYKSDFIVRQLAKKAKIFPEVFLAQKENNIPEKFKFLGMKNALILGYGKEGIVTKQFLKKEFPKLKIGIVENINKKNYAKKQEGWDVAIKTPGINKSLVTMPYTTATNIFLSKVIENNTVIGITGSKGKSTTATLIYEILKAGGKDVEFLGNIGKPMLGYLLNQKVSSRHCEEPTGDVAISNKIFVLELSSYQLDDIKFSPHISVVTNLFPEHLNYHGNLKNYFSAKKNIINFQTLQVDGQANNYFVYNNANKEAKKWLKNYKGKAVPFLESNLKSNLLGQHNKSNIGAAIEVAKILNIPDEIIKKAVENFKGLTHRLEFMGEFNGIKFYDDAISTTPESTIEAIKALAPIGKISTMLLGGQDRGYDFTQLTKLIKKHKIKNIVLFPDSGKKIKSSLRGAQTTKQSLNFFETKNMQEAVKFAYKNSEPGSICLLSCASPSYSVWKNFEEKGNLFKKFVKQLSK